MCKQHRKKRSRKVLGKIQLGYRGEEELGIEKQRQGSGNGLHWGPLVVSLVVDKLMPADFCIGALTGLWIPTGAG